MNAKTITPPVAVEAAGTSVNRLYARARCWFRSNAGLRLLSLGAFYALGLSQTSASAAEQDQRVTTQSFAVEHVRISSKRSFDEVKAVLESQVQSYDVARLIPYMKVGNVEGARSELDKVAAPTGLMILYTLNHGGAVAMEGGGPRKAMSYGIGNVLYAASMTKRNLAAGLYAPIRVMLFEGSDGTAVFEYDKPSSQFGLFNDAEINKVASRIDTVLKSVLLDAGK